MDYQELFLNSGLLLGLLPLLMIWTLIWKGIALWRAGRNTHKVWFVILLIVNTLGILEIIYILTAGRSKKDLVKPSVKAVKTK